MEQRVESEVHDNNIAMVQRGISNDECDMFRSIEARRKARDKARWNKWHKENLKNNSFLASEELLYASDDKSSTRPNSPQPSNTLATDDEPPGRPKRRKDERGHESEVTAVRRSKRTRKLTERAKGDENRRYMRSYQRRERQARKTIRNKGAAIEIPEVYGYSARYASGGRGNGNDEEHHQDNDIEEVDNSEELIGTEGIREKGANPIEKPPKNHEQNMSLTKQETTSEERTEQMESANVSNLDI